MNIDCTTTTVPALPVPLPVTGIWRSIILNKTITGSRLQKVQISLEFINFRILLTGDVHYIIISGFGGRGQDFKSSLFFKEMYDGPNEAFFSLIMWQSFISFSSCELYNLCILVEQKFCFEIHYSKIGKLCSRFILLLMLLFLCHYETMKSMIIAVYNQYKYNLEVLV